MISSSSTMTSSSNSSGRIPVVDFSSCGLGRSESDPDPDPDSALGRVGGEICKAFNEVGFVYLSGHGIPNEQIDRFFKTTKEFFDLPENLKMKYLMRKREYHGFAAAETERLNPNRPSDLKETMNYIPGCPLKDWPVAELPQFAEDYQKFFDTCSALGRRIQHSIALGLGFKDSKIFEETHRYLGQPGNLTALRTLHYPPIRNSEPKVGQLRLGEHSDYGSITLLFQDDVGGLEVEDINGEWIPATPIPGTIVVNIGDMLMRMTAGKLKSNRHRVVLPEAGIKQNIPRFSAAFFMMTDLEAVISPIDGSTVYAPLTMDEYIKMKFAETY